MGIFRRKVRGKQSGVWSAKFVFHKRLHRKSGFPDRDAAQHWIDSTRIALRRGELGYIKPRSTAAVLPLITEYADHLRTLKRSEMYAYNTEKRLGKVAAEAPWMTLADVTGASFEAWRASGPKWRGKLLTPRTLNQYLDHAIDFGAWLVKPKQLLAANPFASIAHMTALAKPNHRRAATLDELARLLDSAPAERALVYRFLIYVPLRRRALARIEWRDMELTGPRATFTLRAELSKTGRATKLAIRADLAELLTTHRGGADADDRVFASVPSMDELREDLKAAGIPFDDGRGARRLDLHAFRKTAIRLLKQSGVPLDEAHVFLQHRDRRTTERYYDDDLVAPEISTAAERMPAIGGVGAQMGAQVNKKREGVSE